jgi:hypothetical protein
MFFSDGKTTNQSPYSPVIEAFPRLRFPLFAVEDKGIEEGVLSTEVGLFQDRSGRHDGRSKSETAPWSVTTQRTWLDMIIVHTRVRDCVMLTLTLIFLFTQFLNDGIFWESNSSTRANSKNRTK